MRKSHTRPEEPPRRGRYTPSRSMPAGAAGEALSRAGPGLACRDRSRREGGDCSRSLLQRARVLHQVMENKVEEVAGPGPAPRQAHGLRHGRAAGEVTLGGRRVQVGRPHVYAQDQATDYATSPPRIRARRSSSSACSAASPRAARRAREPVISEKTIEPTGPTCSRGSACVPEASRRVCDMPRARGCARSGPKRRRSLYSLTPLLRARHTGEKTRAAGGAAALATQRQTPVGPTPGQHAPSLTPRIAALPSVAYGVDPPLDAGGGPQTPTDVKRNRIVRHFQEPKSAPLEVGAGQAESRSDGA